MRKRNEESLQTPIASLIDVVFLLIIFFVVTAAVEKDVVDENIKLAQAKYVRATEKQDPRTIVINVPDPKDPTHPLHGRLNIALQPLTLTQLKQLLIATRTRSGNMIPIVLRGDRETLYNEVDKVMQVVGEAGLYRVKVSAISAD